MFESRFFDYIDTIEEETMAEVDDILPLKVKYYDDLQGDLDYWFMLSNKAA
jgi:hypothetical protein